VNRTINPDSTVLHQVQHEWQKLAAMLLWKLAGTQKVTLTVADIAAFGALYPQGMPVLYTHGHADSIDFQIVDMAAAERLAAHDRTMRGTA
jgi:hypothetical protein